MPRARPFGADESEHATAMRIAGPRNSDVDRMSIPRLVADRAVGALTSRSHIRGRGLSPRYSRLSSWRRRLARGRTVAYASLLDVGHVTPGGLMRLLAVVPLLLAFAELPAQRA